jgi:hypothetical protein
MKTPKPKKILLSLVALSMFQFILVKAQVSLENDIRAEFAKIKGLSREPGISIRLENDAETSSRALEGGVIVVNLNQVNEILSKLNVSYHRYIIRFLIAHEVGHQLQYRYPNNEANQVVNECQADLLAGYLLMQTIGDEYIQTLVRLNITGMDDPRIRTEVEKLKPDLFKALTAVFDLGDNFRPDHLHPKSEQRRTALRDGLAYGNLWWLDATSNDPNIPANQKAHLPPMIKLYKQLLSFREGDNVITWSLRRSKKIVHHQSESCKNIVAFVEWEWNTSADNPVVTYSMKIKNIGEKLTNIDFDNQVFTVLRENSANSLYWDLRSVKSYQVTLNPGEVKSVKDKLKWVTSKELMPSFTCLTDENSLYTCSSTNTSSNAFIPAVQKAASIQNVPRRQDILGVILTSRKSFVGFIDGIAKSLDEELSNDELLSYPSKITVPGAISTEVEFDQESMEFSSSVLLYRGKNQGVAENFVDEITREILAEGLGLTIVPDNPIGNTKRWGIRDNQSNRVGAIALRVSNGNYSVSLRVNQEK